MKIRDLALYCFRKRWSADCDARNRCISYAANTASFALNGIETIPVEAPMPTQLSAWQPSQQNYDHSRRANYELLATVRDMLLAQVVVVRCPKCQIFHF